MRLEPMFIVSHTGDDGGGRRCCCWCCRGRCWGERGSHGGGGVVREPIGWKRNQQCHMRRIQNYHVTLLISFRPSSSLVHSPPPPWLPLLPQWPWQRQQQQCLPPPSSPVWDTMNTGLRRVCVSSLRYVFFSLLFSILLISTYRYHQQQWWRWTPTPTPASTLAMAGGALDEWHLEPWGFFSFFLVCFFHLSFFIFY